MTKKEIYAKLREPINREVHFKYPNGHHKRGVLLERAIVWSGHSSSGADYWNVIDLIRFPDERHTKWIRVGYYRQVGNRLGWAGQTTITEPVRQWKRLLVQAANQKKWFRRLLLAAAAQTRSVH
jgi:hypothetical protein